MKQSPTAALPTTPAPNSLAERSPSVVQCRNLFTVAQFADRYPWLSEAALRSDIFYSSPRRTSRGVIEGNGLAAALVRKGRRVLIDESEFFAWLLRKNTTAHDERVSK